MRLSNLAPHSLSTFDPTRHLTGADIFFLKRYVKVLIKWSKTLKDRNKMQIITMPWLKNAICPHAALEALSKLYAFSDMTSLFQNKTLLGWSPMTDTRVRNYLKSINVILGLHPGFFTFHTFVRVQPSHTRVMLQYRRLCVMVHGLRTVCGYTSRQITDQEKM